jgi:hypothetical protein
VQLKGILSLCAAMLAALALVAASGAGAAKVTSTTKIDVSTRAGVVKYLRSIHVNPKGVVIQRGLRNYAGAHCPGKGWTCAGTRHTVVQIAKPGGQNRFACRTAKCAVVQFGGVSRGLRRFAASRASQPKPPPNTALCVKTTGITQSCVINQPNASGTNKAVVWMVTPKVTGLTQSSNYSASITQGPASATGSSNDNLACVTQFVWIDGSTTKTNGASTTVTNDNHELITITQNSLTGSNTVQGATPSGSSYACGGSGSSLTQRELLTSIVNSKGSITQNQDTQPSTTNCDPYDTNVPGCANVVTDIEQNQNQAGGFKGSASGVNSANFAQSTRQIAVANTPSGTVTQQQNANVPAAPYSGVVGTINQDSTAQSTAVVTQDETQCQDSVSQSTPIPAPTSSATTGSGSAACPVVDGAGHDVGVPPGVTLTQTQYGPLGVGTPPKKKRGRVFFHTKGYGQSQQTGAGTGVKDQFTLTQTSTQNQDPANPPRITTLQKNTIQGECKSSGDTSATGGACAFSQSATLNGVTSGTTTDGYTAGQIGGGSSNPPLVLFCSNGHSTCQPTPPPAPVITASTKPNSVIEAGSGATTFEWTDLATAGVTFQCSTTGLTGSWTACASGDSHAQFANTAPGDYKFYVRAIDGSTPPNASAADSWSWSVVDANISISPSSPVDEVGTARTFTVTVNALPAGTGTPTFADPVITETPTPGVTNSTACDANTIQIVGNQLTCSVTINSNSAGTFTVKASDQVTMGGVQVTRTTSDGAHSDGASAVETYVDANISLSPPTATNEVGTTHKVTCTIKQDTGDGNHFVAAPDGTTCTGSVLAGGPNARSIGSCTTTGGTCDITYSDTGGTGTDTIHATTTFSVGGVSLTRATGDGVSSDGSDVSKTWVDAYITIDPPTASPTAGTDQQVLTISVFTNGSGSSYVATGGVQVTASLPGDAASSSFVGSDSCTTSPSGTCTVTISSPDPGLTTVNASFSNLIVSGVSLSRKTGDGKSQDSGNALIDWQSPQP